MIEKVIEIEERAEEEENEANIQVKVEVEVEVKAEVKVEAEAEAKAKAEAVVKAMIAKCTKQGGGESIGKCRNMKEEEEERMTVKKNHKRRKKTKEENRPLHLFIFLTRNSIECFLKQKKFDENISIDWNFLSVVKKSTFPLLLNLTLFSCLFLNFFFFFRYSSSSPFEISFCSVSNAKSG